MFTLTKQIRFEAAHNLQDWPWSKCHNAHGHSWKLELTVAGNNLDRGAIVDLEEMGRVMKKTIFDVLDHQHINEVLNERNPTCEYLARWAWKQLKPALPFLMINVRVQETETGWATYSEVLRNEEGSHTAQ